MLDTFNFILYNTFRNMDIYEYLELFTIYKSLLTEKQADIFSLHVECDLSLGEISEIKSISRQGVSDTITKTKEILVSYEEKLNLLKKKRELVKLSEDIVDENVKRKLERIIRG